MTVFLIVLLLLCLLAWNLLHGRKNASGWEKFRGVRYAHRGLHGAGAPENSLAAFRRAAEAGYGAELDVHLTKDGRLAVIHDSDLTRVCGASGIVEDLTAAELAAYRLGGTEEMIPFLEQVLPLFEGRCPLVVELKPRGDNQAALTAKTVDCLDSFRADYCLESFDPQVLVWLRHHRPELLRGQLAANILNKPEKGGLFLRLSLTELFYNRKTRPDFVAYRYEDRHTAAAALWRLWGGHTVYWTIRSSEALREAERLSALPIFEGFEPEEGAT